MGFLEDPMEIRATAYLVREITNGRRLFDVLEDPFVRNRIAETRRVALLKDPQLLAAFEAELRGLPDVSDFPNGDE